VTSNRGEIKIVLWNESPAIRKHLHLNPADQHPAGASRKRALLRSGENGIGVRGGLADDLVSGCKDREAVQRRGVDAQEKRPDGIPRKRDSSSSDEARKIQTW